MGVFRSAASRSYPRAILLPFQLEQHPCLKSAGMLSQHKRLRTLATKSTNTMHHSPLSLTKVRTDLSYYFNGD